jgi:hypothetical protein
VPDTFPGTTGNSTERKKLKYRNTKLYTTTTPIPKKALEKLQESIIFRVSCIKYIYHQPHPSYLIAIPFDVFIIQVSILSFSKETIPQPK